MSKTLQRNLLWAGGIIIVALGANLARTHGLLEQEAGQRIILGFMGLMVVVYANHLPKVLARTAAGQRAKRVAGWAMVLSGMAYAAAFVFAPLDVAVVVGCGAVIAGLLTTISYCWLQRRNIAA